MASTDALLYEERRLGGVFPTRFRYLWALDRLVGVEIGSEAYFYRYDAQGSVIALLSAADGSKRAEYAYDAYGACTIVSDTTDGSAGTLNSIRFRGYYWDDDMKLYRLGKRLYDPEVGRFLQPDDREYADPGVPFGLNLYAYCLNDPVNNSDPTGHEVVSIVIAIFIAIGLTINDIVQLATGAISAEADRKAGTLTIRNSYLLHTPWMRLGYTVWLKYFNPDTKGIIKGSAIGTEFEWLLHNAGYLALGLENGKDVTIGGSLFADTGHEWMGVLMKIGYMFTHTPDLWLFDLFIGGGWGDDFRNDL